MVDYEQDLYAWILENVALLRQGRLNEIDVANIIEELEYMARKDKKELISHLTVLLMHLLKWQFQPDKRTRSWELTLRVQRDEINDLLEISPSLQQAIQDKFQRAYWRATLEAEKETGLSVKAFPITCPYTLEQTLDAEFYPQN